MRPALMLMPKIKWALKNHRLTLKAGSESYIMGGLFSLGPVSKHLSNVANNLIKITTRNILETK